MRGLVQNTSRRTTPTGLDYRLGLDLLKESQLAEKSEIAAKIIVKGMKARHVHRQEAGQLCDARAFRPPTGPQDRQCSCGGNREGRNRGPT
jgi:hypothetical protein